MRSVGNKIFFLAVAMLLMSSCTHYSQSSAAYKTGGLQPCTSAEEFCPFEGNTAVNRAGTKYCPNKKRCTQEGLLPPQPCSQPVPAYYGNVSAEEIANGILLIHPVTRTEVLCYDRAGMNASECAESFRASGYVLVTDIPQQPAKYDALRVNTYPTRRWRNGGEVVPRW